MFNASCAAFRAARMALRVFAAVSLLALAWNAAATEFVLHVAASGKDTNDALSVQTPVRTLSRALEIAGSRLNLEGGIVVHFAPGNYPGEVLEVKAFPPSPGKLLLDGGSAGDRAVFDGLSSGKTWLLVRGKAGVPTNLVVRGFEVRNYRGGIQFFGDRFGEAAWSSGNNIEDNVFVNIGQFSKSVPPSLAAISLINSRNNVITRNVFRNVSNLDKCVGLHVLYLAGNSSNNRIVGNTFDGGCGDTIKVRDRSSGNVISGNEFLNQKGKALLVDSFCDGRKVAECRDKQQECPSFDNEFSGNKIDEASKRSVTAVTRTVGANVVNGCPMPAGHSRLIEKP